MKRLFTGLAGLFKSKPSPARTAPREAPAIHAPPVPGAEPNESPRLARGLFAEVQTTDRFLPRTPSRAQVRRLFEKLRWVGEWKQARVEYDGAGTVRRTSPRSRKAHVEFQMPSHPAKPFRRYQDRRAERAAGVGIKARRGACRLVLEAHRRDLAPSTVIHEARTTIAAPPPTSKVRRLLARLNPSRS